MVFWVIYLTTPNRKAIIEKATELYYRDMAKSGIENFNSPELSELSESGYLSSAKSSLMHNLETKNGEWIHNGSELENSDDLKFDLNEAMKSGVIVSGTTGTGKSDVGMYLTDELMKEGIIVVCFDSSQDWQKRSSIPQYQTLTIPHIDTVPENSVIFDISRLSVQGRQNLIESFSETLYRCQSMNPSRKQYFLVFEEGSSYFREGFMRGKRFSNTAMLMSEGRNYGVRFMVITQFFASIDKMSMRYMRQRYFGSTNEPRDVEYITRFFSREQKQEIEKTLRSLDAGAFLYMNGSETKRINISPYESVIHKEEIAIPQCVPIEPIKPKQETNIVAFLRLGMIICFTVLLLGAMA